MAGEPGDSDPQVLIDNAFREGGTIDQDDFAELGQYIRETGSTLLQFSIYGDPVDAAYMLIQVPVEQFGDLLNKFAADNSYRIPFKIEVLARYTFSPTVIIIAVTWGPGG